MDYKEIIEKQLEVERILLQTFRERLEKCPPGYLNCKPDAGGHPRYYHKLPGDPKFYYLNQRMTPLIHELKYKRILQESIRRLEQNVKARERYLKDFTPFSYDSICQLLPAAYRDADIPYEDQAFQETADTAAGCSLISSTIGGMENCCTRKPGFSPHFTQSENPFHREQLIHTTTFGLLTRTKAEASVAELLYAEGFSFCYEKKLYLLDEDGTVKTRYPDFTVPFIDDLAYYMEYDGMYQTEAYRKRHEETMRLYHRNGIYPPKNLILFMEGPDGAFHADSILQTIRGILVPLREMLSPSPLSEKPTQHSLKVPAQSPRSRH